MSLRPSSFLAAALALTLSGAVALAEPFSQGNSSPRPNSPAFAQAPGGWRNRQLGGEKFKEQLNLNDSQIQQLAAIRQKYRGQMEQLRTQMRSEKQELQNLMAGTADAAAIRAQHAQLLPLRQQLDNLSFESMLEMREVLTPQQRSQFAQMMQQRRQQFRNRFRDRPDFDQF
jgi:Spy/CpxP family protein refolding chaperone